MELTLYQVDAFTHAVFSGNPAAVVPLDSWPEDALMQRIAMENNLSETAFFVQEGERYHIRWFTPKDEVNLCGHATLASAYVIFEELGFKGKSVEFSSRSGPLFVKKTGEGYQLDFPVWAYEETQADETISCALGKAPSALYKAYDWVALYDDPQDVLELSPDMNALAACDQMRGILATAGGYKDYDFISRAFFPRLGVPEDPVTGSAHCILAPFWAERLGKSKLRAHQASARGGDLLCEIAQERVHISGGAILYMKGTIYIAP